MTSSPALFPTELDHARLRLGEKQVHNAQGDWSRTVTYKGEALHVQTPWMRNLFGVGVYRNSNTKDNFSLSMELNHDMPNVREFKGFLEDLDGWFKDYLKDLGIHGEYFSAIRKPRDAKYPDSLRMKLKVKRSQFDIRFIDNGIGRTVRVRDHERMISHYDTCRAVIELLPVWCATDRKSGKKRVGISWKVVTLERKDKPGFRAMDEDDDDKPIPTNDIDLNHDNEN